MTGATSLKGKTMTNKQIETIDKLDEQQLRNTISIVSAGSNKDKDAIIAYCETRLDSLNVDSAMIERSEVKVGEV